MKVNCSHCNTAYSVDDAKVAGKKFGFDCPKCGTSVVIDNREEIESGTKLPAEAGFNADSLEQTPSFSDDTFNEADLPDHFDSEGDEPELDLSVLQNNQSDEDLLSDFSANIPEEDISLSSFSAPSGADLKTPAFEEPSTDDDESITIDLNSLDIDLAEPEEITAQQTPSFSIDDNDIESEKITIDESILAQESELSSIEADEDESITLDLDSLDIPLEEEDATPQKGILSESDEDSRLSLDDVGISLDEVSTMSGESEQEDNIDFHMTLDEIDDSLDLDEINKLAGAPSDPAALPEKDIPSFEDIETDLPEIDLEKYDSFHESSPVQVSRFDDENYLDITSPSGVPDFNNEPFIPEEQIASIGGGYTDLSIDYALHYSRLKAFLRLIGIYYIILIPHLLVYGIYSTIAGILNFFNYLIILFSGAKEKDFSLLQENSLRYSISLIASICNVIEEYPLFAGRTDIDSQIQLCIVYPKKPSRILAFLRLTVIGIVIAALPHLILLGILSIGMLLISFFSLLFTIIAGRWPSIMFDFMVRYLRYYSTVSAYITGLIDTYPSFRFE